MLDDGRRSGLVRIEVRHNGIVDVDLSGGCATGSGRSTRSSSTSPTTTHTLALRRRPEVVRALGQLPSGTRAIVGIGLRTPDLRTLHPGADPRDRPVLRLRNVWAEVCGVFLTASGEPCARIRTTA
jgi:hypothetical protein